MRCIPWGIPLGIPSSAPWGTPYARDAGSSAMPGPAVQIRVAKPARIVRFPAPDNLPRRVLRLFQVVNTRPQAIDTRVGTEPRLLLLPMHREGVNPRTLWDRLQEPKW
jgi:hypothetical protein